MKDTVITAAAGVASSEVVQQLTTDNDITGRMIQLIIGIVALIRILKERKNPPVK